MKSPCISSLLKNDMRRSLMVIGAITTFQKLKEAVHRVQFKAQDCLKCLYDMFVWIQSYSSSPVCILTVTLA